MRCHGAEQAPALAVRHDGGKLDFLLIKAGSRDVPPPNPQQQH
jgi:hypothetical protein